MNHTGPLYSGPIRILKYDRYANKMKYKVIKYKNWGINFKDFDPENVKYENLTVRDYDNLLKDCGKENYTFIVNTTEAKVPYQAKAKFSDEKYDTILGTYYLTYISHVKLSLEDE